jgi:DNA-binding transcriptional LysR family regulator
MFSLAQLRGFVAVAEEMHYGRAADRLHLTQPPLTRQIQALERSLGVMLFDRSGRGIKLTPAGLAFLPRARSLLHEAEAAAVSVGKVDRGEAGSIAIGFTASTGHGLLGPLVAGLSSELPDVDVDLQEMVTGEQLDALSAGRLDLGLVRPPVTRPELEYREMLQEELVVVMPPEHRLAAAAELRPVDLEGEDVVMYSPMEARYFYDLVSSILRADEVSVRYTHYLGQIHSILSLVRAGVGVALVPGLAVRTSQSVHAARLVTDHPTPVRLGAVWRRDNTNPILAAVLRLTWPLPSERGTPPRSGAAIGLP